MTNSNSMSQTYRLKKSYRLSEIRIIFSIFSLPRMELGRRLFWLTLLVRLCLDQLIDSLSFQSSRIGLTKSVFGLSQSLVKLKSLVRFRQRSNDGGPKDDTKSLRKDSIMRPSTLLGIGS